MRTNTNIKNIIDILHEIENIIDSEYHKQYPSQTKLKDNYQWTNSLQWISYSIRNSIIPELEKLSNNIKRNKR